MAETGTQAIDRAADLLVSVVESTRPLGIGELSESAGLPNASGIGAIVFGAVLAFGIVAAADQLGIAQTLLNTLFMGVVAARVAGVSQIAVCTPAADALILGACAVCRVDEVYRAGGAHAGHRGGQHR